MGEEVMVAFKKYIEGKADLAVCITLLLIIIQISSMILLLFFLNTTMVLLTECSLLGTSISP